MGQVRRLRTVPPPLGSTIAAANVATANVAATFVAASFVAASFVAASFVAASFAPSLRNMLPTARQLCEHLTQQLDSKLGLWRSS